MADADQERVWFAREVIQLFVKAFTNLKLYPHTHQHVKSALDSFTGRMKSYCQMHTVLRLGVGREALLVNDQPVYEEENRNENLAFRLYVDGLREISISQGVTTEECHRLAMVFYQAIVDPTLDSTLLLWEADFRNIEYAAINQLSEAWEAPDYLDSNSLDLLKKMNDNVEQIVQELTANRSGGGTYEFELTDGAAELDDKDNVEGAELGEREEGDIFEISEDALNEFRTDALAWGNDTMLKTLVEASLDGMALSADDIGLDNVRWLLREALEMALRTKDMELLGSLLSRYEGEMALTEEDEEEATLQAPFDFMKQEENLDRLVEMAQGDGLGGPQAFCRILALLGIGGLVAGVATYLLTKNKELRKALEAFIQDNLDMAPQALLPMVDPSQPADVVRTALFLVSKKKLPNAVLEQLLNAARNHSDPKLKEYATHLWRTKTNEGRMLTMMDALEAETRKDRMRALETMIKGGYRPALDKLKKIVESSDFLSKDSDEREVVLEAIRLLGGKTTIAFLQQQTNRSGGLFNRAAVKETRRLAQQALDRLKQGG